jgi:hypothetical protein
MKYTHSRVRADAIKVRALQLAEHRKTSDERAAKGIVLRARVRACPTLRPARERCGRESKEDEGRAHDVWAGDEVERWRGGG